MNIEKTISEQAVSDILTPMLESQDRIVTEDVAPLFDQATGLDTPPASGTVTTTIEESRSVITAIIRKAWTATLTMLGGASVISSIAAAYTYLRNRLQGNETYGIPDRRSEISASSPLAANLALLNDRKISWVSAPDGMSLVHLLMSSYASNITKLTDNNKGWVLTQGFTSLPNYTKLTEIEMGCVSITDLLFHSVAPKLEKLRFPELVTVWHRRADGNTPIGIFDKLPYLTEFYLPKLESAGSGSYGSFLSNAPLLTSLSMPEFKEWLGTWSGGVVYNMAALEVLDLPKLEKVTGGGVGRTCFAIDCPVLWKVVVGNFTAFNTASTYILTGCPKIRHLESKNIVDASVNLSSWTPDSETLAHQDFLPNFRDYIALRLTDNGSGKTLTLSQEVRNAIHAAEDEYGIENIIITQKGWTISPAPN